jgi:FkbM family methyltransferase
MQNIVNYRKHFIGCGKNMSRPMLLNLLPNTLKEKIFYKFYNHRRDQFLHLYEKASLSFAEGISLYDLLPGDVISDNIAFNGFYELSLTRRIHNLALKGGLFVDVGANIGYFSILWTSASMTSKAICFEVSPRNIAYLSNNVERNSLSDRILIIPKAASKQDGTIEFDLGPTAQTGWGGIVNKKSESSIVVPMTRLDTELSDVSIDVLKIDVEGADTWVLLGCEHLLRSKRIKTIFFEQNVHRMELLGIPVGDAQTYLRDHDYHCEPLDSFEGEWIATPN